MSFLHCRHKVDTAFLSSITFTLISTQPKFTIVISWNHSCHLLSLTSLYFRRITTMANSTNHHTITFTGGFEIKILDALSKLINSAVHQSPHSTPHSSKCSPITSEAINHSLLSELSHNVYTHRERERERERLRLILFI